VPDGKFCLQCGAIQKRKTSRRSRANGLGTAYKRGKTWTASIVVGWKTSDKKRVPVRRSKGGFATKREALEYCATLKTGKITRKEATIKSLYDTFLITTYTKLSASKQTAYKIAYGKIKDIHYTAVQNLAIEHLQGLIDGMSHYTARDIKTLMSHLYKIACAQQHVTTNLAQYMTLPKLEESEPNPFNDEELKKLWSAYSGGDTWIGYILLMIYSGMMPGELLRCKKDMIDLDNKMIVGCGIKTKERKNNPIVIADFIAPVIESLMELSKGDKLISINKDNFYAEYHEKLKLYKCRDLPPYSCRHTTATAMAIGKNISPLVIQRIMRHSKFATTQRYIHPSTSDSLEAINKLKPNK
jgi:integrase